MKTLAPLGKLAPVSQSCLSLACLIYEVAMTFARIFRPSKNAMQSGRAKTNVWCLEFESDAVRSADPLMGWTSSTDTQGQVKLTFDSREDAIAYAQQNGLAFQVTDTKDPKRIPRAYSDNFATNRKMPWSH
jgi:ETC complex I subunit conserved region